MRSFTKAWFLPAVILATGCLAAGCGSAAQDAAGNLASKAATATASPEETPTGPSIPTVTRTPTARATVTATATVTASAAPAAPGCLADGHRDRIQFRLHPYLALDPAGRRRPGRPDRMDRPCVTPSFGDRGRLAIPAHRRLREGFGAARRDELSRNRRASSRLRTQPAGGPTSSGGPMTSRRSSTRCARRSRTTATAPGSRTHSFHCRQPARPWTPSGLLAAPTRGKPRSSAAGWTLSRCPSAPSGPATRSTADVRYRTASPWRR